MPGAIVKQKYKTMKTKVIIERNDNGNYQAVPQMDANISFFGMGKTVAEAMSDLQNSYKEAMEMEPTLPKDIEFECEYDTASFLQLFKRDTAFARRRNRKQDLYHTTRHLGNVLFRRPLLLRQQQRACYLLCQIVL